MPNQDYKTLLTDVIKKQIAILGPQIVVEKVRTISGIKIDDNGQVLGVTDDPQKIIQALIDQFVQLSGLIVKKTMEPLLNYQLDDTLKSEPTINIPTAPVSSITTHLPTNPLTNLIPTAPNTNTIPTATAIHPIQPPVINPMPKPNPIQASDDLNSPANPTPTLNPNPNINNPMPTHPPVNPISAIPPIMPAPTPTPQAPQSASSSSINNPQIIEHKETAPASIDEETQKIINSALNNK